MKDDTLIFLLFWIIIGFMTWITFLIAENNYRKKMVKEGYKREFVITCR